MIEEKVNGVTTGLITAQVQAVLEKDPEARVIGIETEPPADLGDSLRVRGTVFRVARCPSVLAVREELSRLEDGERLLLLTTLDPKELGLDVVSRLAKGRLISIRPWELVKIRFRAKDIDSKLTGESRSWVLKVLLELSPESGFPPAPSGFLDSETVWRLLFRELLGLPEGQKDPETLLLWSLDARNRSRLGNLPEAYRQGLEEAFAATAGPVAAAIFGTEAAGHGVRALSVGLVCRALYAPESRIGPVAISAAARLESFLPNPPLPFEVGLAWADAAESVLRRQVEELGVSGVRRWLEAADELLDSIHARELAPSSRWLPSSLSVRCERYASTLEASHADELLEHELMARDAPRAERVRMSLRLARWIGSRPKDEATSLAEAVQRYRGEGGHVDWARYKLWDTDAQPALARAYRKLLEAVTVRREAENARFGKLFAEWTRAGLDGAHEEGIVPLEHALLRVVAPIARNHTLLVIVIDGMGQAVFRELLEDVLGLGFTERVPEGSCLRAAGVAPVPTVTEACRTSLLCGRLTRGTASTERDGFSSLEELRRVSRSDHSPRLFHKQDLRDPGSGNLAATLRDAVADPEQKVIGVVINAVDDHLAKGDQVRVSWTAHTIRPLAELLDAARDARRVVVMTSDHGHVLERDLEHRPAGPEDRDRWREPAGSPAVEEVLLEGPRVLLGKEHRVILPWTERLRYGTKKNGYHGGASLQEVVVPIAVLAPTALEEMPGWSEVPAEVPSWWLDEEPAVEAPAPIPKPRPRDKGQGELFPKKDAPPTWIERLFESETFREQRTLHRRVKLEDDRIRQMLLALDERGKLTRPALAQRLAIAQVRLPGMLSALRRVLNVEGFDVIQVDEASDTVSFDRALLCRQFEIEER
ncbi:MAG: BREX-2 system phosphatase PglZ [Vicinamibacteria bacterium]